MRHLLALFVSLAALSFSAVAQGASGVDTVGDLARSADRDLAESTRQLVELREQIANEKLPIAQELTALEELVTSLRKDLDRVTRLVDGGNLELARIDAQTGIDQGELDYVANLLDDYVRAFETRLGVGESQRYGEAIATAKAATEDKTLEQQDKFLRRIPVVQTALTRLGEVIGGSRFPGVAVDLLGVVAEGQFAILGPVALFRANSGLAGLVVPQTGSDKPLVRPLEGPMQTQLAALVESGSGAIPLDASKGGALKALVQRTNLIHIFEKGGPIMWPLLVCSILALGAVIERLIFLFNESRRRDPRAQERVFADAGRGDFDAAVRAGKDSKDYVVRTLTYALEHKESSLPNALLYAQSRELKRFKRGISVLDTVITLAPLLGLLGTVTGMMGSFSLIGGDLSAPGAITGGIAEALIATAFGLGIAILSLLPFNYLNTKLDEASHDIDAASTQLKLLVDSQPLTGMPKNYVPRQELVGAGKS